MELVTPKLIEGISCKPVKITDILYEHSRVARNMKQFMLRNRGIGLAAPQIGYNVRLFVMQYGSDMISCYNPSWEPVGTKTVSSRESCLTYGHSAGAVIRRHKMIKASFIDSEGRYVSLKLRGVDACCYQHECDHLDGLTIFHR